jgi:hypothetical protein
LCAINNAHEISCLRPLVEIKFISTVNLLGDA